VALRLLLYLYTGKDFQHAVQHNPGAASGKVHEVPDLAPEGRGEILFILVNASARGVVDPVVVALGGVSVSLESQAEGNVVAHHIEGRGVRKEGADGFFFVLVLSSGQNVPIPGAAVLNAL
jgi:hypothetical protein